MKRFFAIENPYGLTVVNQGQRPNTFHAFPSVSFRDWWVAKDPEHRAVVTSSSPLARRMLRANGELWETVSDQDFPRYIHSVISYLDR